MDEMKTSLITAFSSLVKPVGRFDPFFRTRWVASYPAAPLRDTKSEAIADMNNWYSSHELHTEEGAMLEEDTHKLEDYSTEDLDEFITYHHETVKRIAQSKGRSLSFAEPDDVEQAIMEHVITKWHLYAGEPASRVKSFFEKAANQFLAKERDDYMHFTAAYIYTPADIRRHLRESAWTEGADCPDPDAKIDLNAAFKTITKNRQRAVYKQYGLGIPSSELSEAEGRSARRGVDDMTAWLNRREGVRTYSLDELRGKLFSQL